MRTTLFVVCLLTSINAQARWLPNSLSRSKTESVIVDFGAQSPQGIALEKIQRKKKDAYLIYWFVGNRPFRTVAVPKDVFVERYERLRQIASQVPAPRSGNDLCYLRYRVYQRADRAPASLQEICRDTLAAESREKFAQWYQETRAMFR